MTQVMGELMAEGWAELMAKGKGELKAERMCV